MMLDEKPKTLVILWYKTLSKEQYLQMTEKMKGDVMSAEASPVTADLTPTKNVRRGNPTWSELVKDDARVLEMNWEHAATETPQKAGEQQERHQHQQQDQQPTDSADLEREINTLLPADSEILK